MTRCPMCSTEVEREAKEGLVCSACPMNKGCGTTCCPKCGYTLPPESKIVNMINKIIGHGKDE